MDRSVTVITPTYGRPELLARAVASAVAQRDVDVEVHVVANPDEDPLTHEVLERWPAHARLVPWRGRENAGVKRDHALAGVTTEWVAFLDDDDLWAPDNLAEQLDALDAAPECSWSCGGSLHVDEDLRPLAAAHPPDPEYLHDRLLAANVIPGGVGGVVVRSELARRVGGFGGPDPEATPLRVSEDWDLWIRLSARSSIATVDRPLHLYRVSSQSSSHTANAESADRQVITERYRAERASSSVELDDDAAAHYEARHDVRAGRRWAAAERFAGIALRSRRPAYLAYALAAAAAPQVLDQMINRRSARGVPVEWINEVSSWLPAALSPRPWALT